MFICCLPVCDLIASRARLHEEAGASALETRRGCDFAGGRGLIVTPVGYKSNTCSISEGRRAPAGVVSEEETQEATLSRLLVGDKGV